MGNDAHEAARAASRLQQRFAAIPTVVKEAALESVLKQAKAIADTMRQLAPVDEGNLRDSITVTGPRDRTPAYSQPGGSMTVAENAAAITVGDHEVRYAHLQEYGTVNNAPHPFFWPAVRLHNAKAKKAIKRGIATAVRKNWGRP